MTFITKLSKAFCIVFFLVFSYINVADAEQVDKSVKEVYENPVGPKEEPKEQTSSGDPSPDAEAAAENFSFADIFRMIAAAAFVFALLYFMLRFMGNKSRAYQKGHLITNLGGSSLGGNKSIQIVKIGQAIYVIGVGEEVRLLKEITDESEMEQLLSDYNHLIEHKLAPSDFLSKFLRKNKGKDYGNDPFIEQLKKELDEMQANRKQLRGAIEKKVDTENE
ncbi:MAG: flagellar biosynthetic protein FliO [Bacillus sp. (in: firmicutes)]